MKFGMLTITLLCAVTTAAAEIPPALDVVSKMTETSVRAIVAAIPANSSLTLTVADHPDARWVEASVLRAFTDAGHTVLTSGSPTDVQIVIKDLSTRYSAREHSDSVDRVITVALEAIFTTNGTRRTVGPPLERERITCTRSEAKASESTQHRATQAELPPPHSSMWDDIVEPVIFVTAAVATVVLLFTVRSK
jgi:hypothetical protein